jgi:hypothetical protein
VSLNPRTTAGHRLLAHGSVFGHGSVARAVVILDPARAHELAPLVAESYGLPARERRITKLVQGLSPERLPADFTAGLAAVAQPPVGVQGR